MAWLKQLHEWQQETKDAEEFLESLRFDLGTPEVFIFTPKGSVIAKQARHLVAVIDGVANDTLDCAHKMVYGYWAKK